jgi:acetoacetate decarboxylase
MGYKHRAGDLGSVMASLGEPNYLLKIIPHVEGTPRICELVEYYLKDINLNEARIGPASLGLTPHALAPLTELPVLEVVSANHIVADLTLRLGKVAHDYLAPSEPPHWKERDAMNLQNEASPGGDLWPGE